MPMKKEKIVRAAIQVFKEKGIEKTKISDIVQVAGVAQRTFHLYFPSKLSVMPSIAEIMVEKIIEEVDQTVQEDDPSSKKLEQMIDAILKINNNYQEDQAL